MRIASVKPNDLAVVNDGTLVFVSDALAEQGLLPKGASMIDFITRYDSLKHSLESAIARGKKVSIDFNLLKPPVERPSKIWAAAFNYKRGTSDLKDAAGRGETLKFTPDQILEMTFLKPSSAVIGPEEAILIPPRRKDGLSRAGIVCRHRQRSEECFQSASARMRLRLHRDS